MVRAVWRGAGNSLPSCAAERHSPGRQRRVSPVKGYERIAAAPPCGIWVVTRGMYAFVPEEGTKAFLCRCYKEGAVHAMGMKEKIAEIHAHFSDEMQSLDSTQSLESLRVKVLGKKGELTALLRGMGQLVPRGASAGGSDDQRGAGKVHRNAGSKSSASSRSGEQEEALKKETIDVTPALRRACARQRASPHPVPERDGGLLHRHGL